MLKRLPLNITNQQVNEHLDSTRNLRFPYVEQPFADHLTLVEQYKAHMTDAELNKLYQEGKTKESRVIAGLALGYGMTHIRIDEISHHPIKTIKSLKFKILHR